MPLLPEDTVEVEWLCEVGEEREEDEELLECECRVQWWHRETPV